MKQIKTKILENRKVTTGFYRMHIESPYLAHTSKPGQFVEVKCSDESKPFLRRPLGVHRISKDGISLLYEIVGMGTNLLSKKKKGEFLDIIGPLGNGFTLPLTPNPDPRPPILIGGGVGIAPLLALAEELAYSVERIAYREKKRIYVLIGACGKKHVLCESEFKKLGCEVIVSTEDGSKGKKGLVTELLKDFLNAKRYLLNAKIYACGPTAMLRTVARIAEAKRIPCQVSLEERMACGVGVCLGCPVKVNTQYSILNTQYEYKMVCKDGPVFDSKEIAW